PPGLRAAHGRTHEATEHDRARRQPRLAGLTTERHRGSDRRGSDLAQLTRRKYGRCVALVGRGDAPAAGGSDVHGDIPLLRKTANYTLIDEGLAYPTYY